MKLVLKTRGEVLSVYRINFFDGDNNLGARDYSGHVRVLGGVSISGYFTLEGANRV